MARFDIYKRAGTGVEFLLDLQDEMLESLSTRVVAPLVPLAAIETPMKILNPCISIGGIPYVLMVHLLAAIPKNALTGRIGQDAAG